ncbi:alpha-(1,3)-fucosyltransferase C-like [Hyposmocoma kahamanoa]|uniref:alpha-(1,3)-fucosyltransferase C-like n=1 Tax=Hyposmocoma kahamanoa TaxID=1477025 RepID=UPI000E6D8EB4|nr:alpha-(1,3)-fucosyltransferase C-like [Hyposmocoma kahamanoa]
MYSISAVYDGFFNYTFAYKLDSDVPWRFFVVRNKTDNKVIVPKNDVKWMDVSDMEPIGEEIKRKLQSKNQAAIWLVSHCHTVNNREDFVVKLVTELESYNLSIMTTGSQRCVYPYEEITPCSYWNTPNGTHSKEICHKWISSTHYFYLAFENAMCEDYVTEKILIATKNFAVPIVFGGADYTKFLPPGSYINASDLTPKELASLMNELIQDKNKYYEYFKWHRYYSIHDPTESAETDGMCVLCAFLNNAKYDSVSSVYTRLTWFYKF